jgi:predicted O-methyltransferase YrrM
MDQNIEFIRALINENSSTYKLREYDEARFVPIIRKEVMQFILVIIELAKIKKILEIGTANGYSSICFANTIGEHADIMTIENNESRVNKARENIHSFHLDNNIDVIHDDAQCVLRHMVGENIYDMIFLDGPKTHYVDMFPECKRLLKKDGLLIADNVLYFGMTSGRKDTPKKKRTSVYHLREFLDLIFEDKEMLSSVINFENGLLISMKKGSEKN